MREDLIKESDPKMLAISAGAAVLVHALVFFSFSRISLEQNAYAIGNRGHVDLVLNAMTSAPAVEAPPKVEAVPEPIKIPSEFKKQAVTKPVEKKVVKERPVAPLETSNSNVVQPSPNQIPANSVVGDARGDTSKGTSSAEPDYLNNPAPKYPNESRRKREEGVVMILAAINSSGRVDSLKVVKASGYERLDEAALLAVKDWKFRPARFAGVAVDSNVEIPVRFSLR